MAALLAVGPAFAAAGGVPATRPAGTAAAYLQPGREAIAAGRYKEALADFQKAAADHPDDFEPLHGAGLASLYLNDNPAANTLLGRAMALAPAADRALSYNFAVANMNLGNYRQAAQALRDYLYADGATPDEPLADALGACLYQTGEKNTASRASDDTRKFFSVYTAGLEAQRPGYRKWGPKWLPAAEVDALYRRMGSAETNLTLLAKDLADSKARSDEHREELRTAKYGHGVRSAKDARRLLNDEEKLQKDKQAKYDQALAQVDAARPTYPQLLLPIGLDGLRPPPLPDLPPPGAAPVAVAPPPNVVGPLVRPTPAVPSPSTSPPAAPGVAVVPAAGIDPDQLRQCHVGSDGTVTTDREVKLTFRGTEGRDFPVSGELYLGGSDENGGLAFYFREADGTHRYELTGHGLRAKRLLVQGQQVARFSNPIALDTRRDRWMPFRVVVLGSAMDVTFGGQAGTVNGPLSTAGGNCVVLTPGGRLRNVNVEIATKLSGQP